MTNIKQTLKRHAAYCCKCVSFCSSQDSVYCPQWHKQNATRQERAQQNQPLFVPADQRAAGAVVGGGEIQPAVSGQSPAAFFGMIANLDENIARLEAFLQSSGLRDNTIVIFFNDNGGTAGVRTFNAGMRGQKTTTYEGAHRASLFARWPNGKLRAPADVLPEYKNENRTLPAGVALPIAKARLKLAEVDESKAVSAQDKEITFNGALKAGARLPMQSWFYDANGRELRGAYYAYVHRK